MFRSLTYKQIISATLLLTLCTQVFASGISFCLMDMDSRNMTAEMSTMTGHMNHAQELPQVAMMVHDGCADDCDCILFGCLAPSLTSNSQTPLDLVFAQTYPNNFRLPAVIVRTDLLFRPPI